MTTNRTAADFNFIDARDRGSLRDLVEGFIAAGDHEGLAAYGRWLGRNGGVAESQALLRAGWSLELPRDGAEAWQWRWRRPPKRPGKPGRSYPSTGQAYNALMREVKP